MANENKRLSYIDITRAFAIIFIVIGHAIPYSAHCHWILKFVYSFHVFLFFFLSGYTFSVNKKFTEFLKNKFLRIMVPYYFWAAAFLVPYILFGASVGTNLGTDATFNFKDTFIGIIYGARKRSKTK